MLFLSYVPNFNSIGYIFDEKQPSVRNRSGVFWAGVCDGRIKASLASLAQQLKADCDSFDKPTLETLCGKINGDATLFSMFRANAEPEGCPFHGTFTFSYSRGLTECRNPISSVDSCTEDSRLLFRYQACPDVTGSESTGKRLSCRRFFF
uniref:DUF7042 domain-containing protein n=1 Tax=Strigamia maritima TaxID=126957 RepID=T1JNW2_STRMM